jgi:hypothetical protein
MDNPKERHSNNSPVMGDGDQILSYICTFASG